MADRREGEWHKGAALVPLAPSASALLSTEWDHRPACPRKGLSLYKQKNRSDRAQDACYYQVLHVHAYLLTG